MPKMLWPHEVTTRKSILRLSRSFWQGWWILVRWVLSFPLRLVGFDTGLSSEAMLFINGHNTEKLAYKGTFVEVCQEKGLSAPKQVRIPAKSSLKQVAGLVEEFSGNENVYCKHSLGSQGMGIKKVSIEEVPILLKNKQKEYIVQECMQSSLEVRVVVLKDPLGVQRVCFERLCPKVIGDGKSRLLWLILKLRLPLHNRLINVYWNWRRLLVIPPMGKTVALTHTANIGKGGYAQLPQPKFVQRMDTVVWEIITRLENYVGHALALSCFDILIRDIEQFMNGSLDESIAEAFLLEFQIPFLMEGYILNCKNPLRAVNAFYGALLRSRFNQGL